MRRNRRFPTGALALAVVLIGPAAARAQLFPDLQIKRQRPCPPQEDPRYRMMREQYFGYYPTCWRRFPPGWGCPSPDAPNWEQSKQNIPLQGLSDTEEAAPDTGVGGFDPFGMPGQRRGGDAAPGAAPNLPLPDDTDPFRMDIQPPGDQGTAPGNDSRPAGSPRATDPDFGDPLTPPPTDNSGNLSLPRADASPAPPPADLGEVGGVTAIEAPASEKAESEIPTLEVPDETAPALETSTEKPVPAAVEEKPELEPLAPPLVSMPDPGDLSDGLSPTAPPLAPPDTSNLGGPVVLPPAIVPGPLASEPIEASPALEEPQDSPRRGILARFLGRSRPR